MSVSGVVWRQPRSGGSEYSANFRQKWQPYVSEGEALTSLYINNTGDRICAFRRKYRSGGVLGYDTFWAELENTEHNLGLLLDALMSAERVEDAANLELDDAMQDLENDDGDGLDAERVKAYEKKLRVALDEDTPELSEIRKACILESYKHVGEMKKKCEEFAEKLFGPDRKHVLVLDEKLAHFLWLGSYPDWCDEIMRTFRSHSHRRLNGRLLAHVRTFLKKEGRLESMLQNAYPDLTSDEIKILLKQEEKKKKKKKGEKGKKSPSLIHIDHFLAQLSDCTFNFVVMLNFANIAFGATNRFLAKNLYVGRGVAKQIREVAVETLNGVRAVKEAYD